MSSRAFHAWPIDTAIRAVPRSTTFIAAVASGTPTPATAVVAMMATGTSTSSPALLWRRARSVARQCAQWRTWRETDRRSPALASSSPTRSSAGRVPRHFSPDAMSRCHAFSRARPRTIDRSTWRSV